MAVLGISMELAATTPMWWIVPPFGIAPLVVVLLLVGRLIRKEARSASLSHDERSIGGAPASFESQAEPTGLLQERRPAVIEELTERELEVLQLLGTGRTNDEIARDLFVARGTVKAHVSNIMAKLGATNRTEAVARGRALGLVSSTFDRRTPQRSDGQE